MKQVLLLLILIGCGIAVNAQFAVSAPAALPATTGDSARLPLHDFSITEKDKKAVLRWKSDSLPGAESFFAVERSSNGTDFSLVGISKTAKSGWSEFIDDSPPRGKVFYRVKLTAGQSAVYSEMIAATTSSDISCRFYPNPVDKVLIVRSETAIELQISDQNGKPVIAEKFAGGLKVIDVSLLDPGIYVITLFQRETGRQLTEKLVKK